jgi:hypothetical protein
MQISIRSVLFHVALSALCIAGLVSGPPLTGAAVASVAILLVAYAINAAAAKNETRSFAIGVLIPASMYLALTMCASENEYATRGGRLPTTRMAQSILQSRYSGKTMGPRVVVFEVENLSRGPAEPCRSSDQECHDCRGRITMTTD